jgi:hypothetical protein
MNSVRRSVAAVHRLRRAMPGTASGTHTDFQHVQLDEHVLRGHEDAALCVGQTENSEHDALLRAPRTAHGEQRAVRRRATDPRATNAGRRTLLS